MGKPRRTDNAACGGSLFFWYTARSALAVRQASAQTAFNACEYRS